ncbi:MAG: helix-turn-helix transcriptional regulator [Burkholderiaceae bacterium]
MLVQKLRLQRGWSQEQLAELSGLSVRTIQRIERGLPASTETLKSLASVFEIDFFYLASHSGASYDSKHQPIHPSKRRTHQVKFCAND